MIYQHENYFRDFNNNFYIYCKSVKDYVQRDNFQNDRTIIDYVSNRSIADEFVIDGTVELDYTDLKNLFTRYDNKELNDKALKKELEKLIEIEKDKRRKDFNKIYNKEI